MTFKYIGQSASVLFILLLLLISTQGSYTAERELRALRRSTGELTTEIILHREAAFTGQAFKQLQVLLRSRSLYQQLIQIPDDFAVNGAGKVHRSLRALIDQNRPLPGDTPPQVILYLHATILDYTERQLRLLETLQMLLSFSSIGFAMTILGFILHSRNQEHLARTLKGLNRQHQEELEELKAHISGEIHDKVIQDMALLKIKMESGGSGPQEVQEGLERSIGDLRRLISTVQPWDAQRIGLVFSIEMLVKSYSQHGRLRVLAALPLEEEILLKQRAKVHILRIIQELMSNVVKHSGASLIQLTLQTQKGRLHISLIDNGRGFDPEEIRSRDAFGMVSIRERISNLGGASKIITRNGAGSRIIIDLPMESDDDEKD